MKHILWLTLALIMFAYYKPDASAGSYPGYYENSDFRLASPGAKKFGMFGFDNPAALRHVEGFNLQVNFTDPFEGEDDFADRTGAFLALPNAGFGMIRNRFGPYEVIDYNTGLSFGTRSSSFGVGYGWSSGDDELFERERYLTLGHMSRPSKYVSVGLTGRNTTSFDEPWEVTSDLAVRPAGDERITLFGDVAVREDANNELDFSWSAGAVYEFLPGVRLTARYLDRDMITAGLHFSFGRQSVSSQVITDHDAEDMSFSHSIRFGEYDRNIIDHYALRDKHYISMNLQGNLRHQKARFFDDGNSLMEVLETIEAAAEDQRTKGIVLNLSGMRAQRSMFWEVRNALEEFKARDKKVIIYIDNAGMEAYHLASVADQIIMHPNGTLQLPGYIIGSTYFKKALDRWGVGIDEFRINEYKSGMESFARENMSDADREQKKRMVDRFYDNFSSDIIEGREVNADQLDSIVDRYFMILAEEARELGLIDSVGTADKAGSIIETLEDEQKPMASRLSLDKFRTPTDHYWGDKPEIAVIYAEGIIMQRGGMNAEKIAGYINRASSDRNVKAIVLRINSPGGDGLGSEVIASAIRSTSKPVIVSQGTLAASGGYWISMDADSVLTTPKTVTGSIGVMAAWVYDDGLKDTIRLSTDFVKRGESADLGFSFNVPLLNAGLPVRPLNEHERERIVGNVSLLYDNFIEKVSEARDMDEDSIRVLAEGRVWTGEDAVENGLADGIGSLNSAIQMAKTKAGIEKDIPYSIVEYPEPRAFDFSGFMQPVFGIDLKEKEAFEPSKDYMDVLLDRNGQPVLLTPFPFLELMEETE